MKPNQFKALFGIFLTLFIAACRAEPFIETLAEKEHSIAAVTEEEGSLQTNDDIDEVTEEEFYRLAGIDLSEDGSVRNEFESNKTHKCRNFFFNLAGNVRSFAIVLDSCILDGSMNRYFINHSAKAEINESTLEPSESEIRSDPTNPDVIHLIN